MKANEAHLLMEHYLTELNVGWKREFRFDAKRKWRFDYAIPDPPYQQGPIGIEIDGGIYGTHDRHGRWGRGAQGRHNRPTGFARDLDKLNAATIAGWRVLRFTPQDVKCGKAKAMLRELLDPVL